MGYQSMPPIARSTCSVASKMNQNVETRVRFPRYVETDRITQEGKVTRATEPLIRNMQRGFEAANQVTYLEGPNDQLRYLIDAEINEITHAIMNKSPPDNTISPRNYSVHLLLLDSPRESLGAINAIAHLAHQRDKSLNQPSAATHSRFAILSNLDAEDFLESRKSAFQGIKVPHRRGNGTILLVATSGARDSRGKPVLFSRCAELTQGLGKSSEEFVDEILRTLSNFAAAPPVDDNGHFACPPSCLFRERPVCTETAFLDSVVETSLMFKEMMSAPFDKRFSPYCCTEEYEGQLDFDHVYLRMIPKITSGPQRGAPKVPPDHPHCFTGVLCYAKGRLDQVDAWIKKARDANGTSPFGIPAAQDTAEEQDLALHVLFVETREIDVGPFLSCYGLGPVPGNRLCPATGPGRCAMWQLVPQLSPLDHGLIERYFLCPIGFYSAFPKITGDCFEEAMALLYDGLVRRVSRFFDRKGADYSDTAAALERAGRLSTPPQSDYSNLYSYIGLGMDSPASRLGDVVAAARCLRSPPDALLRMLLAVVEKVGPDVSIDDAFNFARSSLVDPIGSTSEQEELPVVIQELVGEVAHPTEPAPATVATLAEQIDARPPTAVERAGSRTLEDILSAGSLKESSVAASLNKRSLVIKLIATSLGKRKSDFDDKNVNCATTVEPIQEGLSSNEIVSRLTKVAKRLLNDNDDGDELMLAFRNDENNELKLFKIDSESVVEKEASLVEPSPDTCMCICDFKSQLLSYTERA